MGLIAEDKKWSDTSHEEAVIILVESMGVDVTKCNSIDMQIRVEGPLDATMKMHTDIDGAVDVASILGGFSFETVMKDKSEERVGDKAY